MITNGGGMEAIPTVDAGKHYLLIPPNITTHLYHKPAPSSSMKLCGDMKNKVISDKGCSLRTVETSEHFLRVCQATVARYYSLLSGVCPCMLYNLHTMGCCRGTRRQLWGERVGECASPGTCPIYLHAHQTTVFNREWQG